MNAEVALHVWGEEPAGIPEIVAIEPSPHMGRAIPASVIAERGRSWKPTPGVAPGWSVVTTASGVVIGDAHEDVLKEAGVYLGEYNRLLRDVIGDPSGPRGTPFFTVRVFRNKSDFCTFAACAGAANAESMYDPRTREVSVWSNPAMEGWHERILGHELVHAYMDIVWRTTSPLWFAEGMAEFFSLSEWNGRRLVAGHINPEAVRFLGNVHNVSQFLDAGRSQMYGSEWPIFYATAWSFVHYLFESSPDEVKSLLEAGGRGGANLRKHQEAWREYVQNLQAASA